MLGDGLDLRGITEALADGGSTMKANSITHDGVAVESNRPGRVAGVAGSDGGHVSGDGAFEDYEK